MGCGWGPAEHGGAPAPRNLEGTIVVSLFLHAIAAFLYLFVRSAWRRSSTVPADDRTTHCATSDDVGATTDTRGQTIWRG